MDRWLVAPVSTRDQPRLTGLSSAAGCAAKLGMEELDDVLSAAFDPVAPGDHGGGRAPLGIGDDGAVVVSGSDRVVATTDFFPPIVDDPVTWGHVAATNAIGDVHAMGAVPTAALTVLGWPAGRRRADLDGVLAGLRTGAAADGVPIVGGHTIDVEVPFVGLAVLGDLHGPALRQDAGRPGDVLVLTAPVGTGIATTAASRADAAASGPGGPLEQVLAAAVAVMTTSNGPAAGVARDHDVVAATDVTGFGLLGHLHRLAHRSGVDATVVADDVPLLPGVVGLAARGVVPSGSRRNAEAVVARAGVDTDDLTLAVLADAQTSGGLLIACSPAVVDAVLADLDRVGHHGTVVGGLGPPTSTSDPGRVVVTGRVAATPHG